MNKHKTENFMQGVVALFMSQIAIKILGMVYSLYLTNKSGFGDTGNAICFSAYQIYVIFLTISSIGIPNSISKIIAEELALGNMKGIKRILKVSILIFGGIGFVSSVVLYLLSEYIANHFLQIEDTGFILRILSPSIFWITIASVLRGYFNARKKIRVSAKIQIIEQILKTILTIVFVETVANVTSNNTELMAIASTLAIVLSSLISFSYILVMFYKIENDLKGEYVLGTNTFKLSIKDIFMKIIYIAIPISISSFLMSLSKNIDSVSIIRILKEFFGEEVAKKRYGILSSKVELLTMFPMSLNGSIAMALIPEISRVNAINDKKNLTQKINFSLILTACMAMPMMLLMSKYSVEIINFLYPNANDGGELLKISSFSIISLSLIQTINGILQGVGKPIIYIKCTTIGLIVKCILNFILIPIEGVYEKGAIISSIISDTLIFVLLFGYLNNELGIKVSIKWKMLKIVFSIIFSIIIINNVQIHFLIKMILNIIIYMFLILILKVLNENEIKSLPNGNKICIFLKKIKIY